MHSISDPPGRSLCFFMSLFFLSNLHRLLLLRKMPVLLVPLTGVEEKLSFATLVFLSARSSALLPGIFFFLAILLTCDPVGCFGCLSLS